jgi:hypothetical protein
MNSNNKTMRSGVTSHAMDEGSEYIHHSHIQKNPNAFEPETYPYLIIIQLRTDTDPYLMSIHT